jgi:hypothetical protein
VEPRLVFTAGVRRNAEYKGPLGSIGQATGDDKPDLDDSHRFIVLNRARIRVTFLPDCVGYTAGAVVMFWVKSKKRFDTARAAVIYS